MSYSKRQTYIRVALIVFALLATLFVWSGTPKVDAAQNQANAQRISKLVSFGSQPQNKLAPEVPEQPERDPRREAIMAMDSHPITLLEGPAQAVSSPCSIFVWEAEQLYSGKLHVRFGVECPVASVNSATYTLKLYGTNGESKQIDAGPVELQNGAWNANLRFDDPGFDASVLEATVTDDQGMWKFHRVTIHRGQDPQVGVKITNENCELCMAVFVDPGVQVTLLADGFEHVLFSEWVGNVPFQKCWKLQQLIEEHPELLNGFDIKVELWKRQNDDWRNKTNPTRVEEEQVSRDDVKQCQPQHETYGVFVNGACGGGDVSGTAPRPVRLIVTGTAPNGQSVNINQVVEGNFGLDLVWPNPGSGFHSVQLDARLELDGKTVAEAEPFSETLDCGKVEQVACLGLSADPTKGAMPFHSDFEITSTEAAAYWKLETSVGPVDPQDLNDDGVTLLGPEGGLTVEREGQAQAWVSSNGADWVTSEQCTVKFEEKEKTVPPHNVEPHFDLSVWDLCNLRPGDPNAAKDPCYMDVIRKELEATMTREMREGGLPYQHGDRLLQLTPNQIQQIPLVSRPGYVPEKLGIRILGWQNGILVPLDWIEFDPNTAYYNFDAAKWVGKSDRNWFHVERWLKQGVWEVTPDQDLGIRIVTEKGRETPFLRDKFQLMLSSLRLDTESRNGGALMKEVYIGMPPVLCADFGCEQAKLDGSQTPSSFVFLQSNRWNIHEIGPVSPAVPGTFGDADLFLGRTSYFTFDNYKIEFDSSRWEKPVSEFKDLPYRSQLISDLMYRLGLRQPVEQIDGYAAASVKMDGVEENRAVAMNQDVIGLLGAFGQTGAFIDQTEVCFLGGMYCLWMKDNPWMLDDDGNFRVSQAELSNQRLAVPNYRLDGNKLVVQGDPVVELGEYFGMMFTIAKNNGYAHDVFSRAPGLEAVVDASQAPTSASEPVVEPTVPQTAPTAEPITCTKPDGMSLGYIVQSGDTLTSIAKKYGATVQELACWNKLDDPNFIRTGWVLTVGFQPEPESVPTEEPEPVVAQAAEQPAQAPAVAEQQPAVEAPEPFLASLGIQTPLQMAGLLLLVAVLLVGVIWGLRR